MEAMDKLISFVTAFIMILSGCTTKDLTEAYNSLTTGGETVNETVTGRAKVDPADITYASSYSFEKLTYSGIEKMDFSTVAEAETAQEKAGVTLKTDKKGYSGEG